MNSNQSHTYTPILGVRLSHRWQLLRLRWHITKNLWIHIRWFPSFPNCHMCMVWNKLRKFWLLFTGLLVSLKRLKFIPAHHHPPPPLPRPLSWWFSPLKLVTGQWLWCCLSFSLSLSLSVSLALSPSLSLRQ